MFSIIQQNLALLGLKETGFLTLKILDTNTAASLFVTLIGAILVRHQFAPGLRPRLTYGSSHTTKNHPETIDESCEVWQVVLHNAGSGSAIFNSIRFRIGIDAINLADYSKSHKDIVQELADIGLIRDHYYWLVNISKGSTLSPKEDWPIFEIKASKIHLIKQLDATVQFQGLLGDKYNRELFLIPRTQTTPKVQAK